MIPALINSATVGRLMKALPVAEGLKLVDTILNHTQNMKRIELEYKYQKKQMHYQYELASQELDVKMRTFEIMAKQQQEHFEMGYEERKELLRKIDKLIDASISYPEGPYNAMFQSILEYYGQNLTRYVGVYSRSEQITFKGEA